MKHPFPPMSAVSFFKAVRRPFTATSSTPCATPTPPLLQSRRYQKHIPRPLLSRLQPFLVCAILLWLFADFDAYPIWIFRWAIFGDTPLDPAMTHGCASSPDYSRPFAVVIPLIASQTKRLELSMNRWTSPEGYPCAASAHTADDKDMDTDPLSSPSTLRDAKQNDRDASKRHRHLLFYFDRPLDHPETKVAVQAILNMTSRAPLRGVLSDCFANVSFTSASLSVSESRNSYWFDVLRNLASTRGSNAQFWAAFDVHGAYRHMFYMEPDTWPLRPDWLSRVDMLSRDPDVWMRGTMMRYRPRFVVAPEPFRTLYTRHINGNAVYELHDPCFARYRSQVRTEYGAAAFDVAMAFYRLRRGSYGLEHAVAHRFGFTDVVADLGIEEYSSLAELRERLPRTYLAHAKSEFRAVGI